MNKRIPNALLSKFSRFINLHMGIYFPKNRWLDLLRGICSAAREFGFDDVEECIHWLISSPLKKNQIEILACHLTVGETYFFRETKIFEALEQYVMPEIIKLQRREGKRLRLWSAGCCTGEEPYSLAILLSRMIPDIKDWSVTILATDINPLFLQKAAEGIYREWSFRGTPYWIKETYFKKAKNGNYEILPQIKRMVKFSYLNLVEDMYPSIFSDTNAMDVIFCRNVMMYFSPDVVKSIVTKLHESLLEDRWLIVGSSETSQFYFPQYVTVNFPGAILYKKAGEKKKRSRRIENYIPDAFCDGEEETIGFAVSDVHFIPSPKPEPVTDDRNTEKQKWAENESSSESISSLEAIENSYQTGDYKGTIKQVVQNIDDFENNPGALKYLAKAYANQGKLKEALDWCEKAIILDKLNPQFYHLRAAILDEQGHVDKALGELKRALYLDPNFVLAHFMLGNLTRKQGNMPESKKYFENALAILKTHDREEVLPESEGMNAGRLMELIELTMNGELNA